MQYTPSQGETLRSIAARLTLSPEYGAAIAQLNNIQDVNDATGGTSIVSPDVDVTSVLPPGVAIEIPDSWLKTGTVAGGSMIGYAIAGLAAFMLLSEKPKRRRNRRNRYRTRRR